jgi:PAS domain S-box-containing protein
LAGLKYSKPVSATLKPASVIEPQGRIIPHYWLVWLGVTIGYLLAGKAGLRFATVEPNVSAIWPAAGLALAATLLLGERVWPAIFLGAFLVNATTAGSSATSLAIAAGNTLEALTGAFLVNRFAHGLKAFERPQDIFKFMVLAALGSTALSATIGVNSLALAGYIKPVDYSRLWVTWWLGDAAGDIVFTPLVVLWILDPRLRWNRAKLREAVLLLLALVASAGLAYGNVLPASFQRHPIDFLVVPVLLWAVFRFGPRENATANLVLAIIALGGTLQGFGPYALGGPNASLIVVQAAICVMCLSLALSAALMQRRDADEARAGLAAIVDSSDDAIIGKGLDGRITSWNASAEKLFGYTSAQAVGQKTDLIIPPERAQEEALILQRLARGEAVETVETVRLHQDGRRLEVSVAASPIKDGNGRVIGASSFTRDISAQKRIVEALRASEQKFHEMADTVPDVLFTSDSFGVLEYANQRFYDVTGMTSGTAANYKWTEAIHPEDVTRAETEWAQLIRSGQPFQIEYRLRLPDGNYRWFMARSRPIKDSNGRVLKWFGCSTDIDEQKRAEQERERLLRAEKIARAQAEAAALQLRRLQSVTDSTLPELTLERMLKELLTRLRSAIEADTATVLLLEPDSRELIEVAAVGLEEVGLINHVPLGRGVAGQIAISKSGLIYNDLSTVEVLNPFIRRSIKSLVGAPLKIEGTVIGVIHVGSRTPREFTEEHLDLIRLVARRAALAIERTRLHETERAARNAAEQANRAKDEFLAMLGHELRNPLGAIQSSMEILEHFSAAADAAVTAREIMARQLKHLVRLVDDLLDVARVTSGKIELKRKPIELSEILKQCLSALGERLSSYQVSVAAEPVWIDGDATRIEQVITNLLRNAVEYTPAGGRIGLTLGADNGNAFFRIQDSGRGIKPELLPRVFELFVQDNQGLARSAGGLGIGLTLSKRLVELHDGTVEVSSPGSGQGSVFTVRLPRIEAPSSRPQILQPTVRARLGSRVLIVEDNADARQSLRTILELSGHQIYEAADGIAGVQQAASLHPDLALIDIGLPGLDGYEVARRIKSMPGGREIFLVALTGYSQPRDRQQAHEAGFDAHLVKPVDIQRLAEIIAAAQPHAAPANLAIG